MRYVISIAILILLFASCQREEKVVFIKFTNSEGLRVDDNLLLNGVKVGTVLDVDINEDYQVLASVRLSDSLDFPKDSGFEIQSQDLFTKIIFVTIGQSKTFLENGDTIQGLSRLDLEKQTPHDTEAPKILDDLKEMFKN